MNESEAIRCYELAQQAVKANNFDKAERLLTKSIKMHETQDAQVLLKRLDYLRSKAAKEAAAPAPAPTPKKEKPAEPEPQREFTADDQRVCQEVIRSKDYYAVLGVEKKCTDNELKKAFRKKALKVHPDKNACPQASEAFKKVNAAMACLSDAAKRREYDQVGSADRFEQRESRGSGGGHHFHGNAGDFVSPEDLFNHFFYGQDLPRNPRQAQRRQQQRHHHARN